MTTNWFIDCLNTLSKPKNLPKKSVLLHCCVSLYVRMGMMVSKNQLMLNQVLHHNSRKKRSWFT